MIKSSRLHIHFIVFFFIFFFFLMAFSPVTANQEKDSNKAVSVKILKISSVSEISGEQAGKDHIFFILETEWENIHPKQKVEKDKLEGKTDRTMGVGTLAGRKKKKRQNMLKLTLLTWSKNFLIMFTL